jgi:CheY-like chemotaxis protein
MDVLLLTADLTTSSSVTGAAEGQGLSLVVALHVEGMLATLKGDPARLVILDLAAVDLDVADVVARLRDLPNPPVRIAAFGPHVQEARLAAARQAGCDHVLSRGAFFAQLDEIVSCAARD